MEENYFLSTIKNIGWKLNNLFSPGDKADIMRSVLISETDAELLTSTGTTSQNADERNKGMWMGLNSTITGKSGITTEHYFENIYKKLACCSGKSQITVPILKRNESTGKIERIYKTIRIDRAGECTMNGQDWADDNTTEASHKPHCEDLMQRLIAFLSKYDPENPMIDSYGGCLANKHLNDMDEGILKDPFLLNMVNTNRSCLMPTCNRPDAYKRKSDRKSCTTTICQADIGVSVGQAAGAISVFGNQIQQNCGPESELSKALAKGEEEAEVIIAEKTQEIEKEIEDTEKEISESEKEISSETDTSGVFLEKLNLFFTQLFASIGDYFKTEGFGNINIDFLNKLTGVDYPKYIFFAIIFIIVPTFLFNNIK